MIGKRLNYLWKYYKEYNFKCLTAYILSSLFPRSENALQWRKKILQYKHMAITKYLYAHYYSPLCEKSIQTKKNNTKQYDNCIWTAWLQGEENAPEVIRLTIASIRKNADGHPVIVLTEKNIEQYIEISASIKQKHEAGIIGHAHFTDIIRMKILEEYGGIWLDATTLLYEPIDAAAFSSMFYSVGFGIKNERFVSGSRWIIGLIGGCKDSKYLFIISKMLSSYWEEHNLPIDYFVFDYLVNILYQNNKCFHGVIDKLPQMDMPTYALRTIMNEVYNEQQLYRMISNHQMHILTYKYSYQKQTSNGEMTNFGYLFNKFLK